MNISAIPMLNQTAREIMANTNFCQKLCIDMQYNNWIFFNFLISIFIILNTKFDITKRCAKVTGNEILIEYFETKNFNMKFVGYFVAINLFFFLLQFAYEPVIRYISCS